MPSERVLLEVCTDTPDGVSAATEGGADRIELCSALEVGGLTPSHGLVAAARAQPLPVFAMVRPRAGDFVYSPAEVRCMLTDIEQLLALGVDGFVFGALDASDQIDAEVNAELLAACAGRPTTLHRAFDHTPNRVASLERAIELGFHRVLTSGGARTAVEGTAELATLLRTAADHIQVLAGGGLTSDNLADFLATLDVREVHASCKKMLDRPRAPTVPLGRSPERVRYVTDAEEVHRMAALL